MTVGRTLIRAAAVVDGAGVCAAPGAVLLEGDRVLAAGPPEAVGAPGDAAVLDLPREVVLPALVNAHAHLDLSHIGPVSPPRDFASWADAVRARRATTDADIGAAVAEGVRLARAGGTALVGDIAGAGSTVPVAVQRREGLPGVSFLEVFGLGLRQGQAVARLRDALEAAPRAAAGVRLGVQPHAPYSCGPEVFAGAAALGAPLATHLAETLEEIAFVRDATGPLADLVRRIGAWDDTIAGHGVHPVDLVTGALDGRPCLAAHLNYLDDRHLDLLARSRIAVVYCPRSSAYFGHPARGHPPHRYREMIAAGITVALGTDSILGLDTPERICVLDEVRFLHARDGGRLEDLLALATVAGAAALGFDPGPVTLRPGPVAGLLAVEVGAGPPLEALLRGRAAPRWIRGPVSGAWR